MVGTIELVRTVLDFIERFRAKYVPAGRYGSFENE
jgi:hypothetical protein